MQTNDRTRYNDEELAEFRTILEEKLGRAREQMDYYKTQLQEIAQGEDGKLRGLDDGTGTRALEEIQTLAARQQKLLRHLENALIRIENKVYGICRETGKLISKERLLAVPHATLSIAAKQSR